MPHYHQLLVVTPPLRCVCLHLKKATRSLLFANHSKHQHRNLIGAVFYRKRHRTQEIAHTTSAAVRTWCGGKMSIINSNAMRLRFASGVPYGFRDRQRVELVQKVTCCKKTCKQSSQQSDQSCFCTNTRTTHTRQNKPYRLRAAPAGLGGHEAAVVQQRRYPQLSYSRCLLLYC